MSKKTVSLSLPPMRADPADAISNPDQWVLATHVDRLAEPTAATTKSRLMIDLSAERSLFELMQLICLFPWLATWSWLLNAARLPLAPEREGPSR